MWEIIIPAGLAVVALLVIGVILGTLYTRAARDMAYVRTGLGGKKVVTDGGAIVLPIFHSIAWVNLKTLRLDVRRGETDALITYDKLRVDIGAEFFVRVKNDAESIALAAQTLGQRTNDPEQLRELIEAKFVDGLRSVAATMEMNQLQEKRADFVKAVQEAVSVDLQVNGLELETVSLTRFDQTDIKYFNANNIFDAQGLAALSKITEERKRERNEIVRTNEVAIAQRDLQAKQETLNIQRTQREAELNQERDVANIAASTRAEVARQEQTAQRAEEEARIDRELAVAEREASASQSRETAVIESDLAVKRRKTEADRDVQIVAQDAAIAVAERSEAESQARAKAEDARATAVAATEKVDTAKAVEVAERGKRIAVIAAEQEAETEATAIRVAATAEKNAAEDRAEAIRVGATADADAAKLRAEAIIATGEAEAKAVRAKNEARNSLDDKIIAMEITQSRIAIIPLALAEIVRPMEKISDIRIFDTGGMLGRSGGEGGQGGGIGMGEGLAGQLLAYNGQRPVLDEILRNAGFEPGKDPVGALVAAAAMGSADAATAPAPSAPAAPAAPAAAPEAPATEAPRRPMPPARPGRPTES